MFSSLIMYINILIFPLLSSFFCGLLGRKIGHNGIKCISISMLVASVLLSIFMFVEVVVFDSEVIINLWCWFDIGLLYGNICLLYDKITCSMLILICLVSSFVHVFSLSYMNEDPHLPRFISYLSLFTFFMIVLVTSNNLLQLFIGWEGVGLCSYLLINFWFTRIQANKSAIKAMIINKLGDLGLLLGIILIWKTMGSINYHSLFSSLNFINNKEIVEFCSIFLLIGVVGKSAQIGLHTWLPDAMEGPSPVSALIHAATMVTAGVFLIVRMSPLFENSPITLILIVLIGSLTAFFSATIGLVQNDLKKIIAYSTCSQLGYMVMICGFSHYNSSLFHLINHGFFKALLFLSAGSIIHSINDEQDIRKLGIMNKIMPVTYVLIFVGSISLMGLPFLTGFYSKDFILELVYSKHLLSFSFWLGLLAASATAFYSFRLIYYTFINVFQGFTNNFFNSHEGNYVLIIPLLILSFFSIVSGYYLRYFILKDEFPVMINNFNKLLPLLFSLLGASFSLLIGFYSYKWWKIFNKSWINKLYTFLIGFWYFDSIFNSILIKPVLKFGFSISYKLIDNQVLEVLGPYRSNKQVLLITNINSKYNLGKISVYSLMMVIFVFCFIIKL